jgi:Eco57I restriction endonuclease.
MEKRHKDILRALVGRLRAILVGRETDQGFMSGNLDRELERIGIAPDGTIAPIDALLDARNGELYAYRVAADQLSPLAMKLRPAVRQEIIERAAYTWINRLLALRAMEVRNLIDDTLRAQEEYDGLSEQLYLLRLDHPALASGTDRGWWAVLNEACQKLSTALPGLFSLDDPAAALHPSADALVQCVDLVGGRLSILPDVSLAELDAAFADPDAIGWSYQFYQEQAKAAIDLKCKNGGKAASRSELAAKTQLFTEPYMVQWLLQNSLGRSYHEAYPASQLPEQWPYYIKPAMRPDNAPPERIFPLDELTLLDPCMGSGHFLREAFDMFVAMYREQQPELSIEEIVRLVLSQHIFGIDLDPRAAQLAALTLYLRAWEMIREEQRRQRKYDNSVYVPPRMNLATTPTNLHKGMLKRHLERNPHDRVLAPLLKGIFEGLEQADILGSLLRSREYIDQAIEELRKPQTIRMDLDSSGIGDANLYQTIVEMARVDPIGLRQKLFDRIADSFRAEASTKDDVSISLFGYEAERGVRLLQVLDRQYAVVVTNPPYLGSSYMEDSLKRYVAKYYASGKRDLYAAFILRCLELCSLSGRVAMVTMQSWMFLRSFAEMRAIPVKNNHMGSENGKFQGLLRETCVESLAHLGSNAFEEISGEVVQSTMFTLLNQEPKTNHEMFGVRLVGFKDVKQKKEILINAAIHCDNKTIFLSNQNAFLSIPDSPLVYYLNDEILSLLTQGRKLKDVADVRQGLATADDNRFLRFTWEVRSASDRWATFTKGGGYSKWFGQNWYHVDWEYGGSRAKAFGRGRYQGINYYFRPGWSYSRISSGSIGLRRLDIPGCIGDKGPGVYIEDQSLVALFQSHALIFILRASSPQLAFEVNTLMYAPLPQVHETFSMLSYFAEVLKRLLVTTNIIERSFLKVDNEIQQQKLASILHTIEGVIEHNVIAAYCFSASTVSTILDETGTPAGWYPLIAGYDTLPALPDDIDIPQLTQEFFDYLAEHERIALDNSELTRIKANLRTLYEAGPGAKNAEVEEDATSSEDGDNEEANSGAHIPIPTETFLEELSVKMKLHPISVYWLLEELRAEGARCKPEERRLLEDRLTVIVLRLLGHRWPKQVEAGEPVPDWADKDGIIPLVSGTGERTLAEQIRERLYAEDGAMAAQQTERLLEELTGQNLELWLRTTFFTRHISQFKHRPIAWHLASTPVRGSNAADKGKKKKRVAGGQRTPAFECFVYYHACAGDVLARIRTQYVEPLLQAERMKINNNQDEDADDTVSLIARERINELEAFVAKLREIEDHGFASPELAKIVVAETLDRWCDDGYQAPASRDEFRRNEEAWHVDINDGVRVNIAPLQLAGVLTKDVLNKKDATKALSDRVRWRADERRWVREGTLPRCGWMDEMVPASPAWDALASQREAEQAKLAQKRLFAQDVEQEEVSL